MVRSSLETWRFLALAGALAGGACAPSSNPAPTAVVDAGGGDEGSRDPSDATTTADANGGRCAPGDVPSLQAPTSFPVPLGAPSSVCNGYGGDGGLVSSYAAACLGGAATYPSCTAFARPDEAEAGTCYGCLTTPGDAGASAYGVVLSGALAVVNYGACVAALDPSDKGQACALLLFETAQCADAACKATCPVTDEASQLAYSACVNDALLGVCMGLTLESSSCVATEQGDGGSPVATICFGGSTASDHYQSMARFFCGAN